MQVFVPSSPPGTPYRCDNNAAIYISVCLQTLNSCQVEVPGLSASVPAVCGGGAGAEGAMPSVDVDLPSASASLDVPGERGCSTVLIVSCSPSYDCGDYSTRIPSKLYEKWLQF